jgi:hypothetical protein
VSLYLKKPEQTEIGILLKRIVEISFSFLLYKIALKLKLLKKNPPALRILLQSNL